MVRLYQLLAKIVTVYALVHPCLYVGSSVLERQRLKEAAESVTSIQGEREGEPAVSVEGLIGPSLNLQIVLQALLISFGLMAAGAIFQVAASLMILAANRDSPVPAATSGQ
jgi:hypothetical protein